MNDPWDVKSVRQSGQYVSCMKINGIPLLPPLLSKECRKEMQYYKLLAKEVEKRISVLQPYAIVSDTESSEDKTDAPELPECEQDYDLPHEEIKSGFYLNLDKVKATEENYGNLSQPPTNLFNSITSNVTVVETTERAPDYNSPKFIIDLSLNINDASRINEHTTKEFLQHSSPSVDIPERDNNNSSKKQNQKELLVDCELGSKSRKLGQSDGKVNFIINVNKNVVSDPFPDLSLNQDGPSSLSAKSFTGSLNDIHTESMRESQFIPKLTRQRSYTLLKPGPQLLAHLEVQSLSTGVEMSSISMSESLSNLNSPCKKRRSWDLESAKVKWSSMALELKQKQITKRETLNNNNKTLSSRSTARRTLHVSPPSTKSAITEKIKQPIVSKNICKSEPIQRGKRLMSPTRNTLTKITPVKETITPDSVDHKNECTTTKSTGPLISESDDPATRVRELYEKIQTQQLIQMANLVEKQKREQMLLQQVFEEQNNLLYTQLKTICPKPPTEVPEVWGDEHQVVERGPVSLSQLINHRSPDQSLGDSSLSSTLTDTNHYINHCDNVLKKSRDITGSIKKQQVKVQSQNGSKIQSSLGQTEGCRTRTHSPTQRNPSISRRLNYDTSASSEREYEPVLTDRTNDTMAGLNVTFPSDNSEECAYNKSVINHLCGKEVTMLDVGPVSAITGYYRSTDSGIRSMEKPVSSNGISIPNGASRTVKPTAPVKLNPPTAKERAAATRIVAHAKGFLVRRLMRTERVQGIVQTIKDALLCALQLHQDREGIRGADVDLHRRLIQQITAACYSLHDTFIASAPAERCAIIAADRSRRRSLAARQPQKPFRQTDRMSQSYSGAIPSRNKRLGSASLMTQSNYETFSGKCTPVSRSRHMSSPRRRPWR